MVLVGMVLLAVLIVLPVAKLVIALLRLRAFPICRLSSVLLLFGFLLFCLVFVFALHGGLFFLGFHSFVDFGSVGCFLSPEGCRVSLVAFCLVSLSAISPIICPSNCSMLSGWFC